MSLNLITLINSDFFFIFFQIIMIYIILQIFQENNVLRLVLNILILLLILVGLLMLFQFELFACFLLVSEILLFAFIYAYLFNLNLTNKLHSNDFYIVNLSNIIIIGVIGFFILIINNWNILVANISDLYIVTQRSLQIYTNIVFSDLIFLFNFFFIYNTILYMLLILILFIMTFIIIYTTFLVYLLNLNAYLYIFSNSMQIIDSPNYNGTLFLKKKKKKLKNFVYLN